MRADGRVPRSRNVCHGLCYRNLTTILLGPIQVQILLCFSSLNLYLWALRRLDTFPGRSPSRFASKSSVVQRAVKMLTYTNMSFVSNAIPGVVWLRLLCLGEREVRVVHFADRAIQWLKQSSESCAIGRLSKLLSAGLAVVWIFLGWR